MKKDLYIDNIPVGPSHPVFIIAEAGVNHNGNIDLAKRLVLDAKRAGADCVKFQTFKADRVAVRDAPKADYQLSVTDPNESQLKMLRRLELNEDEFQKLFDLCKEIGIIFMSTPYSTEDVDFLDNLGVAAFKLASIHITEHRFLQYVSQKGKPMIISTGMATLAEIDEAVSAIIETGNKQILLMQCISEYPAPIEDVNLRAMLCMRDIFNISVGYSDHSQSLTPAIVATGLGASVIERHFTIDKGLSGPDHACSSDPKEFSLLIRQIREAEKCLGSGIKGPTENEEKNKVSMRRSIVTKTDIQKGAMLSWANLTLKRPAVGISAANGHLLIGRSASQDISADTIITLDMVQ